MSPLGGWRANLSCDEASLGDSHANVNRIIRMIRYSFGAPEQTPRRTSPTSKLRPDGRSRRIRTPLIHLRAADVASHALGHVLALMRAETEGEMPGSDVATGSLATLVLVHALRTYLATSEARAGWLGALADARIGRALSRMHAAPGERWSVDTLAGEVGMSRTAFAQRFGQRVGSAPLEYLQAWRMSLAMTALADTDEPLARIAERVGYLSDTAFSIAFKRSTGESPGRYRSARRRREGALAA